MYRGQAGARSVAVAALGAPIKCKNQTYEIYMVFPRSPFSGDAEF